MATSDNPKVCSKCWGDSKVIETRDTDVYTRRRRKCTVCGHKWQTVEIKRSEYNKLTGRAEDEED